MVTLVFSQGRPRCIGRQDKPAADWYNVSKMDHPRSILTGFRWLLISCAVGALAVPLAASAHQNALLQVGDKAYWFSVGYLSAGGEDQLVSSRAVLDFNVWPADPLRPDVLPSNKPPVPDIARTFTLEVLRGEQRKKLTIVMQRRVGGSDNSPITAPAAVFIPTVADAYSFHFSGTLNFTPVDITFTCNTAGHFADTPIPPRPAGQAALLRTSGAIACPTERHPAERFPESLTPEERELQELREQLDQTNAQLSALESKMKQNLLLALGGATAGLAGIVAAAVTLVRRRQPTPYG